MLPVGYFGIGVVVGLVIGSLFLTKLIKVVGKAIESIGKKMSGAV